jgi:hypothetical protein
MKLCECGCGQATAIATRTVPRLQYVKGQPKRFVKWHNKPWLGQVKHRKSHSPEHGAWRDAKRRCTNPKVKNWKHYGGRGIRFLFTSFEQFFAELGPRPAGTSLDRINNDGNYEPGNVRWATRLEQTQNRRCSRKPVASVKAPLYAMMVA